MRKRLYTYFINLPPKYLEMLMAGRELLRFSYYSLAVKLVFVLYCCTLLIFNVSSMIT